MEEEEDIVIVAVIGLLEMLSTAFEGTDYLNNNVFVLY